MYIALLNTATTPQDEPEEMNFVRKHARQQADEMGVTLREAATRIFSNASGSYSSNVNLAVENSSWSDESQLQEMYMNRKSYAFNSDRWVDTAGTLQLRCSAYVYCTPEPAAVCAANCWLQEIVVLPSAVSKCIILLMNAQGAYILSLQ